MSKSAVKLIIIAAQGGGRADLTAGWLGILPGFINGKWVVDIPTGVSYGNMGNLRGIDDHVSLLEILSCQDLTLSPDANLTWATAIHGHNLKLSDFREFIDSGAVTFVAIDTAGANQNTIAWEFCVKTYLSDRLSIESLRGWGDRWVGATGLDQDGKIYQMSSILKNYVHSSSTRSLPLSFPCITLEYIKMFRPEGSKYICEKLGLQVNKSYHDYWNAILPFTHSPDTLDVWGVTWRKQDWFPD